MPRAPRSERAMMARPKKVMARTTPADRVMADEGEADGGQRGAEAGRRSSDHVRG